MRENNGGREKERNGETKERQGGMRDRERGREKDEGHLPAGWLRQRMWVRKSDEGKRDSWSSV